MIDEKLVDKAYTMLLEFIDTSDRTHSKIAEKTRELLNLPTFSHYSEEFFECVVSKFEENIMVKTFEPDILVDGEYNHFWVYNNKIKRKYFGRL